jgi:hypothetical protein
MSACWLVAALCLPCIVVSHRCVGTANRLITLYLFTGHRYRFCYEFSQRAASVVLLFFYLAFCLQSVVLPLLACCFLVVQCTSGGCCCSKISVKQAYYRFSGFWLVDFSRLLYGDGKLLKLIIVQ